MNRILPTQTTEQAGLRNAVALKDAVEFESVILFEDSSLFIEELLKQYSVSNSRLLALSPCRAEIVMAADRADIDIVQLLAEDFTDKVSETDIIFLENPNRSNGSNFSLTELKSLLARIPDGLLLIDEYYFDFLRISAAPLLKELNNIVVLRYFNDWLGASTKDRGYALVSSFILKSKSKNFSSQFYNSSMSRISARICYEQFGRSRQRNNQLREIQTRCLQLAREITDIGLMCRLTAADFLIVAVDSAEIAAELQKQNQLNLETIHNQNRLTNLLRCRVTLTEADDELIETLRRAANTKKKISKAKIRTDQKIKDSKAVHVT
ncbi:MAG: aminotransferase class I/II-fold pyridoxal phosphate-dependent enzyme [candidate division Zixibacteria bacterium]|nr:aminotransferase class I/II-fold pyridoxal phosphate-dependent enzyme [candidate division Zixibacteria bacterium]